MSNMLPQGKPTVAVVGGGLAGLAAAAALSTSGCQVALFESRRHLGGRATSFRDPATGEMIDNCQHVSMGCCTNLADFCRHTEISDAFRRDGDLCFFGPDGTRYTLSAAQWMPAPLHLAPSLLRLGYLSLGDRLAIGRAMWRLMRMPGDRVPRRTIGDWLVDQRQSPQAIERFWGVIIVSALGESLARASLAAARKVFVDGFFAHRRAYEIEIPQLPLGELYGTRLQQWLAKQGVDLHLATAVKRISLQASITLHPATVAGRIAVAQHRNERSLATVEADSSRTAEDGLTTGFEAPGGESIQITFSDGTRRSFDFVVLAVPWRQVASLVDEQLHSRLPWIAELGRIEGSPITGVHLWFDRPVMDQPHAVLVGRLSQWIFQRGLQAPGVTADRPSYYYQVVISASHELAGRDREGIAAEVCEDIAAIWPAAREARVLATRVVTDPHAVFSVQPDTDDLRPAQQTPVPGLYVAGDWTKTGWPATMEGAVRAGYLAAEGILAAIGRPQRIAVPDLPRALLSRLLIR